MKNIRELADKERGIAAESLAEAELFGVTLVDLREADEFIISTVSGAVNIPFSEIGRRLYAIPKDKPVLLFCREGDWSSEVLELLTDAGYDAYHIIGGYNAYRRLNSSSEPKEKTVNTPISEPIYIDALNLKCPGPIVKISDTIRDLNEGSRVFVKANETAFASDIRVWCERTQNKLISIEIKDDIIEAVIEKHTPTQLKTVTQERSDKTIVIFSGDLDKTIAAFIIANGAAAMGRRVTLFFTFWGLNILRRPKRMRLPKGVIERCMGAMMPRGTAKLGLSRMNMGGIGAKMIRHVMKSKNVFSLEELIEQAKAHRVRLVACQMSMDIMGIRQEELIDGVELGGVSTFLGAGENSDMSLFI